MSLIGPKKSFLSNLIFYTVDIELPADKTHNKLARKTVGTVISI